MNTRTKGILAAILSAFLFGSTAIMGRISYNGGSNGITLTFLRNLFALPVLLFITRSKGVSLRLTREEFFSVVLVGAFGPSLTTLLLYSSYEFIPVGIATILHYMAPVTVAIVSVLFFKEHLSSFKIISLVLGVTGIALFFEAGTLKVQGIILALLSSCTYAVYMLGVEHTSLRTFYYFKLSFWFCLVSMIISGIFGGLRGDIHLHLTFTAWVFTFLVSMLVSVVAITLFQTAIPLIGSSTTAIISTIEPITGLVMGWIILSEEISIVKLIGSFLVLSGVCITALASRKTAVKVIVAE